MGVYQCIIHRPFQLALSAASHGGSQSMASEPQRGVLSRPLGVPQALVVPRPTESLYRLLCG